MKNGIAFLLFVCLALCLSVGCNSKTVTVSGTVTFDGEPGQNINVLFQGKGSDAPETALGKTNAQGQYSLSLLSSNRSGAEPGEYVVYISWVDPNANPNPIEGVSVDTPCPYKIPALATSGRLNFTVPEGGTRNADFKFDSKEEEPDDIKPGV